jgi:leucyl/phenylalanyl-tRNA--protein transferase
MHGSAAVTPEILLHAYAQGIFPMAERRDDPELYWVSPERRGIIPLDSFHIRKRLARTVRSDRFRVTADTAFADVLLGCAEGVTGRPNTWINAEIMRLYTALHDAGRAHSIECWDDQRLVGGLYGVSLGGAFFGESMFSRERDASKVALVHLIGRLTAGRFQLLDAQFMTQFGAIEITRLAYLARLREALAHPGYWPASSGNAAGFSLSVASGETGLTGFKGPTATVWPGSLALQVITHTS